MKNIIFAFKFFSNIPIFLNGDWTEESSARALGLSPLVAGFIGIGQYIFYFIYIELFDLSIPFLGAVILLLIGLALKGTILIDGLADTCDGLLSYRNKEKTLEIMKDSRIGALGSLGLTVYLITIVGCYYEIMSFWRFGWLIIAAPMFGNFMMCFCAYIHPCAKSTGLSSFFKAELDIFDVLLAFIISILPVFISNEIYFIIAFVVSFILVLISSFRIKRRIGGMTGDTYGFISCIGEACFLIVAILSYFIC